MLNLTIEKVFEEGLHEFLVRYLKNLFILATIIETDFRCTNNETTLNMFQNTNFQII